MRGHKVMLLPAAFLIALLIPEAWAGGSTASFLKIGVGARPVGMGQAFVGIADDVHALAWNPAGLSRLSRRELGAMHAEMFADTRYDFVGYAQPMRAGTLGAQASYLSQAAIESRGADRKAGGGFAAYDMAVGLGYGRMIWPHTRLGTQLKYLQSLIADVSAQGWAVDFGALQGTPIAGLDVGLAVQNLGPGLKFMDERSPLPLTLAAGLGYRLSAGMLLALDVRHLPHDRQTAVSVGSEYAVFSAMTLRAGYLGSLSRRAGGGSGADYMDALHGLGAGFGLRLRGYGLDYAMTPFGELGNAQRVSLNLRF